MNSSTIWLLLAVALVVGLASVAGTVTPRYVRRPVMTPNEVEFFRRLTRALEGSGYVFPQVSMSALIRPKTTGKAGLAAFRRISQKTVDYAIHALDFQLVCVVELDDSTHNARKDAARDALLQSAGVTTIRWHSKRKPATEEIRATLMKMISASKPSTEAGNR